VRSIKRGGRLVTCGATSGFEAKFDLRMLFFKNIAFMGSTMGSRGDLWTIVEHMASGRLKAVVDRVLPLDQVRAAHAALEGRTAFGKIVLVP
jgi:NADPH:quinone reductase-like Zn-dependent oxidoreductase